MTIVMWVGAIWLLWAILVTGATFVAKRIFTEAPATISGVFWGQTIFIHPDTALTLEPEELMAIHAHEEGHRYHHHLLENYLMLIFLPLFAFFRKNRLKQQEFEADDYAADKAGALTLASAISKISSHPRDNLRVFRLRWRHYAFMMNAKAEADHRKFYDTILSSYL